MESSCLQVCGIAFAIAGSQLYTALQCRRVITRSGLEKLLTPEQSELYRRVVDYRTRLFLKGILLSLVLAVLVYILTGGMIHRCFSALIVLVGTYLFYTLVPKDPELQLLPNLSGRDQLAAWSEINRQMRVQMWTGFFISIGLFAGYTYFTRGDYGLVCSRSLRNLSIASESGSVR